MQAKFATIGAALLLATGCANPLHNADRTSEQTGAANTVASHPTAKAAASSSGSTSASSSGGSDTMTTTGSSVEVVHVNPPSGSVGTLGTVGTVTTGSSLGTSPLGSPGGGTGLPTGGDQLGGGSGY